jgi:cation diffusion facilitator family transporter
MAHGSTTAVLTAIFVNSGVTVIKLVAALLGGSAAMFNEAVHSLLDALNQVFLYIGLREAARPADQHYAFGHIQKKYLWNLWSAIGLFSIGAGLGLAHAWHSWAGLAHPAEHAAEAAVSGVFSPLAINLSVLAIAFVLEGYSFWVALKEFFHRMRANGYQNPLRYLLQANDPTLVAVVLEDSAAMLGLGFALFGIGLTALTGNLLWDIGFSALIAVMLGFIAVFLGYTNMRHLVDPRDLQAEQMFIAVVAAHPAVERYHDLRSILLDEQHTLLVAELELKEEAMTDGLLERVAYLQANPGNGQTALSTAQAFVQATLERAEAIIDAITSELRAKAPQVSHVTVEIEGIHRTEGGRSA